MLCYECVSPLPTLRAYNSSLYHNAQASSMQTARTPAPPSSRFPAALDGEVVDVEPVAEGVPVPEAELVVEAAESVPFALENLPVY